MKKVLLYVGIFAAVLCAGFLGFRQYVLSNIPKNSATEAKLMSVVVQQEQLGAVRIDSLVTQSKNGILLNFWATWCKPCVAEFPLFPALMENLKKEGIDFYAISDEPMPKIATLKTKHQIPFALYGMDKKLSALGIQSIPYFVFIDKNQKISWTHTGNIENVAAVQQAILKTVK